MRSFFHVLLVLPAVIAVPVLLENKHADTIANSWIVRVNADSILSDVVFQVTEAIGVEAARTFEVGDFKGFSINNVPDLLSLVANIASIESIEPNSIVRASALVTQNNVPSYGLARISHRRPGATSYIYDSSAGAGTFSYIIDTVSLPHLPLSSIHSSLLTTTFPSGHPPHPPRLPRPRLLRRQLRPGRSAGQRLQRTRDTRGRDHGLRDIRRREAHDAHRRQSAQRRG